MPLTIAAVTSCMGCLDPLTDYDECVRIETARCDLRKQCETAAPAHFDQEFGDFDYDTCIAYLKENCRVRQIEAEGWREQDIVNCVNAILALHPDGCTSLTPRADETEPLDACWFIRTSDSDVPDASVTDAGSDASGSGDGGLDSGLDSGS